MLTLSLLALLLAAPPPDLPRAQALLASPRSIDKAWGAYLAGRLNLTALVPKLTAELDHLRPVPTAIDREGWSLAHTLLDALIEVKAPLTFDQLKPWLDGYRHEALILLLQNAGQNQPALLELRPNLERRVHWLAVTNTLVQQRTPGIAAAILSEIKPSHMFPVQDSPAGGFGMGTGGGFSNGCGTTQFAKGFPPAARYQLVDFPSAGDTLFAPGPTSIYLRRIVVPTDAQIGWSESSQSLEPQTELIAYLAAISGGPTGEMRRRIEASTVIQWTTPEAFSENALLHLQLQAIEIRQLAAQLTRSGLLTTQELSTIRVNILPSSTDYRQNRSEPIPTIPPYAVDFAKP